MMCTWRTSKTRSTLPQQVLLNLLSGFFIPSQQLGWPGLYMKMWSTTHHSTLRSPSVRRLAMVCNHQKYHRRGLGSWCKGRWFLIRSRIQEMHSLFCSSSIFVVLFLSLCRGRVRRYRIFYDLAKYEWRGPPIRTLLKLLLPLQPLRMDCDDLYFLRKSELVSW